MHNILTHFLINNVFQDLIRTKNSRSFVALDFCQMGGGGGVGN